MTIPPLQVRCGQAPPGVRSTGRGHLIFGYHSIHCVKSQLFFEVRFTWLYGPIQLSV